MASDYSSAGLPHSYGPQVEEVTEEEAARITAERTQSRKEENSYDRHESTSGASLGAASTSVPRRRAQVDQETSSKRRFNAGPDLGSWEAEEKNTDENGHYFNVHAAPHIQKAVDEMCKGLEANSKYKVGPMDAPGSKQKKAEAKARSSDFACFAMRAAVTLAPAIAFVIAMAMSGNPNAKGTPKTTSRIGIFSNWKSSYRPGFHIPGMCGLAGQPLMVAAMPFFVISLFMRGALGWKDLEGWRCFLYAVLDNGGILLAALAAVEYPFPASVINPISFPGFMLYLISIGMKELGWGDFSVNKEGHVIKHKRRFYCWLTDFGSGVLITLGFAEWYAPGLVDDWLLVLGVASLMLAHGIRECTDRGADTKPRKLVCKLMDFAGWFLPLLAAVDYCLPGLVEEPLVIGGSLLLAAGVAVRESRTGVGKVSVWHELVLTMLFGLGQLFLAMVAVDCAVGDVYDIHLLELAVAMVVVMGGTWLALVEGDDDPKPVVIKTSFGASQSESESSESMEDTPMSWEKAIGLWPAVFVMTSFTLSAGVVWGI